MKKILFCCMLAAAPAITFAQQAETAQSPADIKAAFTLRVNQLDGALAGTDQSAANDILMDLMGRMQVQIGRENQAKESANATQKEALQTTINKQNKLYGEIKSMTVNPAGNRADINAKLTEFEGTF